MAPGIAPCAGPRAPARDCPALRPGGGSGRARGHAVGGRAPARGDPQGAHRQRAAAGCADPHPRRADGGAHAAGERIALRHARATGGRGPEGDLHQPQARRGAAGVAPHRGAARRPARGRPARGRLRQGAAGRGHGRAQRGAGGEAGAPAGAAGARTAGGEHRGCRQFTSLARPHRPAGSRRRGVCHRRGGGQRAGPAGRVAVRTARVVLRDLHALGPATARAAEGLRGGGRGAHSRRPPRRGRGGRPAGVGERGARALCDGAVRAARHRAPAAGDGACPHAGRALRCARHRGRRSHDADARAVGRQHAKAHPWPRLVERPRLERARRR